MKDKTTDLFEKAPIPQAVMKNIIPTVVGMLMVLVYNLADTFFIGQTKDPYMVAAVSLATPAFLLFMAIGMLFGIGGTSLISRMLGQGKKEYAKHASSFCFWTGAVVGVIGMVAIWIFCDSIAMAIGASKDTVEFVKQYLLIVACGVPFLIVSNSFSSIIRAEGSANKAMNGMILGNVVNIVVDAVMILLLGWNVAGAAFATVLGNVASAVYYLVHLLSKKSMLSISPKMYKVRGGVAAGVLAIGIPASLNSILMSTSNIVINNLMKQYGDMAVAGLGVAMKVNMIAVMLLIGVGTGIQPLLGYCYGAKNRERFKGVLKFSLLLAIAISLVMSALCYLGAGPMVNAFLEDPKAYDFGMEFARILIISGPVLGVMFVMINAIQAMGAAIPSMILSVSRQGIIYFPMIWVFNTFFHSERMLTMTQPVTDYVATALSVLLFVITYKKYFGKHPETNR